MYYEEIFREFNKEKVKYAVAGGVAVNLYGVERFTHDLDLMLAMDEKNLLKAVSIFKRLGYTPKVPVSPEDFAKEEMRQKWIKEKNMIVFSFIDLKRPHILIDIIINAPFKYKDIVKNIKIMVSKNKRIKVPVISMADLIKMKKIANRLKDNNDIELLKMAKTVLSRLRRRPRAYAWMNAKEKRFGGMSLNVQARQAMSGGITPTSMPKLS